MPAPSGTGAKRNYGLLVSISQEMAEWMESLAEYELDGEHFAKSGIYDYERNPPPKWTREQIETQVRKHLHRLVRFGIESEERWAGYHTPQETADFDRAEAF